MSGLLDLMARTSLERWHAARSKESLLALRARCADLAAPPSLKLDGRFDLIAEVKLKTPSEGTLAVPGVDREGFVVAQAARYEAAGACAISVLTEPLRFGGELSDLQAVAAAVSVPAMRKDFLVAPYQVWEARAVGAGGVLAIARMLEDGALHDLLGAAVEAGLFVLLEAFDAADLARCREVASGWTAPTPLLVGVNTRNLVTLAVDAERLGTLAPMLPSSVPCVAESGITGPEATRRAAGQGYQLGLVGSALMRAEDPRVLGAAMLAAGRRTS
jgi:indole-3-glycerol phosphate synthase